MAMAIIISKIPDNNSLMETKVIINKITPIVNKDNKDLNLVNLTNTNSNNSRDPLVATIILHNSKEGIVIIIILNI